MAAVLVRVGDIISGTSRIRLGGINWAKRGTTVLTCLGGGGEGEGVSEASREL